MTVVLASVVGGLFTLGTFLMLRRDLVRVVWGVAMVSQAANVYLISMGGIAPAVGESVPILAGHGSPGATADPVVQALVLTAIVISFGTTAFAVALTYRAYQENDTMDVYRWQ